MAAGIFLFSKARRGSVASHTTKEQRSWTEKDRRSYLLRSLILQPLKQIHCASLSLEMVLAHHGQTEAYPSSNS